MGKPPSTRRRGHVQTGKQQMTVKVHASSRWRHTAARQAPRHLNIPPIPQTSTFPSTNKRNFGQSSSLACNTRTQYVPPFKTQAVTYFTAHFQLTAVQSDTQTQSLPNEPRTSPQKRVLLPTEAPLPRVWATTRHSPQDCHLRKSVQHYNKQQPHRIKKIRQNNLHQKQKTKRHSTYLQSSVVTRYRNRYHHGNATHYVITFLLSIRTLLTVYVRTVDSCYADAIMGPSHTAVRSTCKFRTAFGLRVNGLNTDQHNTCQLLSCSNMFRNNSVHLQDTTTT